MEFTEDEKKVLIQLLDQHIEEVQKNEGLMNQMVEDLAMEVKYEDFLQEIKKKLE